MRRRRPTTTFLQVILTFSLLCFVYFAAITTRRSFSKFGAYNLDSRFENHTMPLQTHLFDNMCKFAWTEPLDSTLKRRLKFPKRARCEHYNIDLFKRYPATGEFSLKTKNYTGRLDCTAQVLKGGLRPEAHTYQLGKSQTFIPRIHKRFWVNADNFLITCFSGQLVIYRKQFMGFKMSETLKLVVDGPMDIPVPDPVSNSTQFSISILGLDSTSRAQFIRHLRKTADLLNRLGSVTFEAYNKVGDNSAINLLPILADELVETRNLSFLDSSGDVNLNKILPSKVRLDPDVIKWVWKQLPSEYVTMFNDDIMHTSRGLFHYPPDNFLGGFAQPPARFYYRPYYNHLYSQLSNWWRKCLDGELLAEHFIDSWFRFERVFSKVPHFGFSFLSSSVERGWATIEQAFSLTHDDPNNLEMLDHTLFHRLDYLNRTGSLENTILIILGDHGNRVHPLNRYTFAGKIGSPTVHLTRFETWITEERAPFLSILTPPRFRRQFSDKFQTLKANAQRFVSNFDLHATLKSLIDLSKSENRSESRGTSLFEVQNTEKSCQDNNVISNHCLCMVDASQDLSKVPKPENLVEVLENYIGDSNLDECFQLETLKCGNVTETLMPNNYVQVWARTKISDSEVRRKKEKASAVIYPYMKCHINSKTGDRIELFSQFRLVQSTQETTIAFPPRVRATSGHCSKFSFPKDYCNCVSLLNAV